MFRNIVVLVAGLASLSTVPLPAQEAVLGQKYGRGVHAYFAGDYPAAYEQLTTAIEAGSKDPRVFYFRGLTELKLGRQQEGKQDFIKGGTVGKQRRQQVLQRVEGPGAGAGGGADRVGELPRRGPYGGVGRGRAAPQSPLRSDPAGRIARGARAASRAAGADCHAPAGHGRKDRKGRRTGGNRCRSVRHAGRQRGASGRQEAGQARQEGRCPAGRCRGRREAGQGGRQEGGGRSAHNHCQ